MDDITILAKKFDDTTILAEKIDDLTILAGKIDDITILAEKIYDITILATPLEGPHKGSTCPFRHACNVCGEEGTHGGINCLRNTSSSFRPQYHHQTSPNGC